MKFREVLYDQIKDVKLGMVHCLTIAKLRRRLRNTDIELKIIAVKCSWFRRLFYKFHGDWKMTSFTYNINNFDSNFKFRFNLSITNRTVKSDMDMQARW